MIVTKAIAWVKSLLWGRMLLEAGCTIEHWQVKRSGLTKGYGLHGPTDRFNSLIKIGL